MGYKSGGSIAPNRASSGEGPKRLPDVLYEKLPRLERVENARVRQRARTRVSCISRLSRSTIPSTVMNKDVDEPKTSNHVGQRHDKTRNNSVIKPDIIAGAYRDPREYSQCTASRAAAGDHSTPFAEEGLRDRGAKAGA